MSFNVTFFFLGECKNLQDLNLSECQGLSVSTPDFSHKLLFIPRKKIFNESFSNLYNQLKTAE